LGAQEEGCVSLKFSRIPGRLTDWRDCFHRQCAHCQWRHDPGAHVAGIEW